MDESCISLFARRSIPHFRYLHEGISVGNSKLECGFLRAYLYPHLPYCTQQFQPGGPPYGPGGYGRFIPTPSILPGAELLGILPRHALIMALVLWCTIAMERETRTLRWVGYGLLWGFAALNNAVVLATLPFLLGWIVWRRRERGIPWRFSSAVAILMMVLVVTPSVREKLPKFGRFIPFRSEFWYVFWQSNTGDTSNIYPDWANAALNGAETEKYIELGEIGYMKQKRQASLQFLRRYPGLFLWLTVKRIMFCLDRILVIPPGLSLRRALCVSQHRVLRGTGHAPCSRSASRISNQPSGDCPALARATQLPSSLLHRASRYGLPPSPGSYLRCVYWGSLLVMVPAAGCRAIDRGPYRFIMPPIP